MRLSTPAHLFSLAPSRLCVTKPLHNQYQTRGHIISSCLFPAAPPNNQLVLQEDCVEYRLTIPARASNFGTMVPAPKRLDSVEVHNHTSAPVSVTVVFDDHKEQKDIAETIEIAPNTSRLFAEKILNMGSWQAVAPVKHLQAGSHTLAPDVGGVVKKMHFHVREDGAGVKLEQGERASD